MIRVLVADDQAAVRAGFAALITAEDEMEVAGEAADGREAVDLVRRSLPHVVLMDIRMPRLDGLEATRLICADPTLTDTRVLVLTTFDLDEYVYAALRAGASGFQLKDTGPAELRRDPRRRGRRCAACPIDHKTADRRVRRTARRAPGTQ